MKNLATLPCDYHGSSWAGMAKKLFTEWLLKVDNKIKKKSPVLLIIDNCSTHLVNIRLTNARLEFLSPNCTSLLQPLDQGIIKSMKAYFRRRLVERLLINLRMKMETTINM